MPNYNRALKTVYKFIDKNTGQYFFKLDHDLVESLKDEFIIEEFTKIPTYGFDQFLKPYIDDINCLNSLDNIMIESF